MTETKQPVPTAAEPTPFGVKRHYHLFAIMVVYEEPKTKREKRVFMNTISPSEHPYVSTMDISKVQFQTQVRFRETIDPKGQLTLLDLYIQSFSYMGHMTLDEFDGGLRASEAARQSLPPATGPETGEAGE